MNQAGNKLVQGFLVHNKIGAGTFGQVWKATDMKTQESYALKIVKYETPKDQSWADHEVRILGFLESHGVSQAVRLDRYFFRRDRLVMVLEYHDYDLATLIASKTLNFEQSRCILAQLCVALSAVHSCGILHRDLKSANVLLDAKGRVRIGDFGSATLLSAEKRFGSNYVTLHYRPPELLTCEPVYGLPVDLWSLGCIFAEVLSQGGQLFRSAADETQMIHLIDLLETRGEANPPVPVGSPSSTPLTDSGEIPRRQPAFTTPFAPTVDRNRILEEHLRAVPEPLFEPALDLVRKMLRRDPSQRITASETLTHPFLDDLSIFEPRPLPKLPVGHYWAYRQVRNQKNSKLECKPKGPEGPATRDASPKRR
jgi:serine/threonine protein kinase